jgi:antitoxin CcdA
VGQWEIGLTRPRLDRLKALSTILRQPLSDLVGGSEPEEGTEEPGGKQAPPPARRDNAVPGAIELDPILVEQAESFGIDIPTALDAHLRQLVGRARAEQWLKENREALADANAFLARHGLWSDGKRQF